MDIYYKQNGDWNMYPLWYKSNGHWNLVGKSEDMIPLFGRLDVNEYTSLFEFPQSLGDFNSTGEQEHDYFASEEDGDPVVLTYNNFTINEGHIVTPTNRCKGMYLNILGDLVVNGTLSMTARGAKCEGQYIGIDRKNRIIYFNNDETSPFIKYRGMTTIDKVGGLGISGVIKGNLYGTPGLTLDSWRSNATGGINGACGAGGGTCGYFSYAPAKGGNGTSFSGGAGAGGGASYWNGSTNVAIKGNDAEENGGAGGNGTIGKSASTQGQYGGGGAGNPGGICPNPNTWNGQNGTGGLMILFVSGNIIISDTGSIQSNGSNGGNGRPYTSSYYGTCGGGGSGGGAIHIFHQKSIINKNNIIANGGISGTSGGNYPTANGIGDNGGNGTINIVKI